MNKRRRKKRWMVSPALVGLIACLTPLASYAIIGGGAPSAAVRSSTVSVVSDYRGEPNSICSGTLIAKDLVLTAAHCFSKIELGSTGRIVISFGEQTAGDFSDPLIRDVEKVLPYPGFGRKAGHRPNPLLGDIALVKLKTSAPLGFTPVPIASARTHLKKGDLLLIAGFGTTDDKMSSEGLFEASVAFLSVGREFVLGDQSKGSGGCNGDSGGPEYIKINEGLAIVSETRGSDEGVEDYVCNIRAAYTDLFTYRKFIAEGAKKLGAVVPIFLD